MVLIDELIGNTTSSGAPAVVSFFYPGQQGGDAIMDVLFGKVAPAGRLPYTWYRAGFVAERGKPNDQDLRSKAGITYRYYRGTPLLPFGFGLGTSTIKLAWGAPPPQGSLSIAQLLAQGGVSMDVEVTNTGQRATEHAVLLFATFSGSSDCPRVTLLAFSRVHVAVAASTTTTLRVDPRELACVNDAGTAQLLSGTRLRLGCGDAATQTLTTDVQLTGATAELPP
eukprot:m.323426 g.323426  ORF g.323426 m.323426 type:complete len:225 (+) comp19726_c0_seq1:180-854(+)